MTAETKRAAQLRGRIARAASRPTLSVDEAAALPSKVGQASAAAQNYLNARRAREATAAQARGETPPPDAKPALEDLNRAERRARGQRGPLGVPATPRQPEPRWLRRLMKRRGGAS